MAEKYAVGVDFGGTKILAGVVNLDNGRLVSSGKKKTRQVQEHDDVIKRLNDVIDEALIDAAIRPNQLAGIGIGAAGQVDRKKGVLVYAANIGVSDVPLAQPISNRYKVPCYLGNDVEVATLGELKFGAGRRCDSFVCIFVGTGIGSGIVSGGTPWRGHTGSAGEIGHIVIDPHGRLCGCGALGCLEAYASRTAIAKHIVNELKRGTDSFIRDKIDLQKGILRSKALAEAVQMQDELVVHCIKEAAEFMGMGLATVMNFYNPQRIILGGGLIQEVDLYFQQVVKVAKRQALKVPTKKIEIVKAELGDYSGVVGAAMLVRQQ
jgi:glucokinase